MQDQCAFGCTIGGTPRATDPTELTIESTGAVLGATARGIDLARPLSERSLGQILLALGRYGCCGFPTSIWTLAS
jgi:hypothetical protein